MDQSKHSRWLAPAADIVMKFSTTNEAGATVIASNLSVDKSRVYRWMYAKDVRGTGGLIPAEYHRPILNAAKERNIALSADDIIGAYCGSLAN